MKQKNRKRKKFNSTKQLLRVQRQQQQRKIYCKTAAIYDKIYDMIIYLTYRFNVGSHFTDEKCCSAQLNARVIRHHLQSFNEKSTLINGYYHQSSRKQTATDHKKFITLAPMCIHIVHCIHSLSLSFGMYAQQQQQ